MTTVERSTENIPMSYISGRRISMPEDNQDDYDDEILYPIIDDCHPYPVLLACDDSWTWSNYEKSREVKLVGTYLKTAHFHPNWSSGTAGVRGTRILNNGKYFWELRLAQRIFGTSMMFGIGTKDARLHADCFTNLIGEDYHGWGLSHKGHLWHGGTWYNYTKPFRENEATTIGMLFDGVNGTLTYYKDGRCLGVAFRGLNNVKENLYPMACSTAAKTEMTLENMKRDFINLQDRCRAIITNHIKEKEQLNELYIPPSIKRYLSEAFPELETSPNRPFPDNLNAQPV